MTAVPEVRAYICEKCQRFVADRESVDHLCVTPDFLLGVVVAMLPSKNAFYALTAVRSGLEVSHLDDRQFNDGMDYGFGIAASPSWERNIYEVLPAIQERIKHRLDSEDADQIRQSEVGQRLLKDAQAAGAAWERSRLMAWEKQIRRTSTDSADRKRDRAIFGLFRKIMSLEPEQFSALRAEYLSRDDQGKSQLYKKFRFTRWSSLEMKA